MTHFYTICNCNNKSNNSNNKSRSWEVNPTLPKV